MKNALITAAALAISAGAAVAQDAVQPACTVNCQESGITKSATTGDVISSSPDSASATVGDTISNASSTGGTATGNKSDNKNDSNANNTGSVEIGVGDTTGGSITQDASTKGGNIDAKNDQTQGQTQGQVQGDQTATTNSGAITNRAAGGAGGAGGQSASASKATGGQAVSGDSTSRATGGAGGRAVSGDSHAVSGGSASRAVTGASTSKATGGQGGKATGGSSRAVSGGNVLRGGDTRIDASQRTTIKHAAQTAAQVDMTGYGAQNCMGDTNPSGQFGASMQTFGWGVTANSHKASNVCAIAQLMGPKAAVAYLAQMDPNVGKALVNNGLAVSVDQVRAQQRAEAKATVRASAAAPAPVQRVRCPADHPRLVEVKGEIRCYK